MNKLKYFGLGTIALLSTSAFAEGEVATAVADFQTTTISNITSIGVAMIAVAAVAIGFKWTKAALFG
ncbi:hypothetical protein [Vibrio aestuarianus]|uniref:hypothetical protein n=1 Tax=Vibrio aestuarianus TaxID=28171 RepID=UPI0021C313CE|nr:hypothetical protein [Vibrio aestuarianus]CAH8185285.1 conserved exported hypothetical protein [Vibrio aestuarianus]